MVKRKKECTICKKLKTLSRFFKKSRSCLVCDKLMDKKRDSCNRKWTKYQNKLKKQFTESGGIIETPIVGRTAIYTKDKLVLTSKGHPASEGVWMG